MTSSALRRLLQLALGLSLIQACHRADTTAEPAERAPSAPATTLDPQKIVGRWVRPDGGYVLQLTDVAQSGHVAAAYFNPSPIHVAHAEWRLSAQNLLIVAVELRDLNYPGATYTLRYDPATDRLAGAYHQPVQDQTYDIEFVREAAN